MKLEAVNPEEPEEICVATVSKVKESYLWLQLESKLSLEDKCFVSGLLSLGVMLTTLHCFEF